MSDLEVLRRAAARAREVLPEPLAEWVAEWFTEIANPDSGFYVTDGWTRRAEAVLALPAPERVAHPGVTREQQPGPYSIGSDQWPGLSRLAEESGELLQVVGKLIGSGGAEEHWDGSNLRDRLLEEMADVFAAIKFVRAVNGFGGRAFGERVTEKYNRYLAWHREGQREAHRGNE